jgi:hypothetical protein
MSYQKKIFIVFLLCVGFLPLKHFGWSFVSIQNDKIFAAFHKQWGGAVISFTRLDDVLNVVNWHDTGRNICQSFYDKTPDGSYYVGIGKAWTWNPVQGGDQWGNGSQIAGSSKGATTYYCKTIPKHWAAYPQSSAPWILDYCWMKQWVTLSGEVMHIRYKFRNDGGTRPSAKDQEMPAAYFIQYLSKVAYYKGGSPWTYNPANPKAGLTIRNPPSGNSPEQITGVNERWVAYINTQDWGVGMYFPETNIMNIFRDSGSGGSLGTGTSHAAPIENFTVQASTTYTYDVYFFIANVGDIRNKFNDIRLNGLSVAQNGSFELINNGEIQGWRHGVDTTLGTKGMNRTHLHEWIANDDNTTGSHGLFFHNKGDAYHGDYSVVLSSSGSGSSETPYLEQEIRGLIPGAEYRIEYKGKCEDLSDGEAGIRIIQFGENDTLIADSGILPETSLSGTLSKYQQRQFQFRLTPKTRNILIRLQINDNNRSSQGRAWFDNFRFAQIPLKEIQVETSE